jgi:hypothetical protein
MANNMSTAALSTLTTAFTLEASAGLFTKVLAAGRKHRFTNILTHRSSRLLDLGSFKTQMKAGYYAGQREVALDDIHGTEGRQNDFDDRFNPLSDWIRQRWQSVAKAFYEGMSLPPVELIQVGEVYFVRDGHHRISVARAFGQTTITARVTVW